MGPPGARFALTLTLTGDLAPDCMLCRVREEAAGTGVWGQGWRGGGAPGPQGALGVFLAYRFEAEAGREAGLRFVPREGMPTHLAGAGSLNQDRVTR